MSEKTNKGEVMTWATIAGVGVVFIVLLIAVLASKKNQD
ncbi:LPXTG cell wall anchor domain-containing protein [Thalassotalea aquiviva]